nr:MAG: putative Zn-dependent protease, DUF2268 [Candidatus Nanosalinarum sp. J07AB56]
MKDEIHPTPAELQEARRHAKKALRKSRERLQKDEPVKLCLGWTEDEFVLENMDGVTGHAFSSDIIKVRFNARPDMWVPSLKTSTAHEFAHAWHYEQKGRSTETMWEHVLDEAITQNFAEQVYPEYETSWRKSHPAETVAKFWPQVKKKELDRRTDDINWPSLLYIDLSDDGDYPNWLGYSMSYLLGKELLKDRNLEEMPDVSRQELVDAGDRLFAKP